MGTAFFCASLFFYLFQIFQRFHKGSNGNFGLGLSIAKTSISMMDGEIVAENADGALFTITLPLNNI